MMPTVIELPNWEIKQDKASGRVLPTSTAQGPSSPNRVARRHANDAAPETIAFSQFQILLVEMALIGQQTQFQEKLNRSLVPRILDIQLNETVRKTPHE